MLFIFEQHNYKINNHAFENCMIYLKHIYLNIKKLRVKK